MLTDTVVAFVRASLPDAPARVLEVGAGEGRLAALLGELGYDVLAIDPAPGAPHVQALSLHEVAEPAGSFDAAVAMLSLHHVEPLEESCRVLAELVRPGGTLVIDELDIARLDERATRWWAGQRAAVGAEHPHDAAAMVADMRSHLHPLERIADALADGFELGLPVRGSYLHRWHVEPGLRGVEEQLIAAGRLPATGARLVGTRRR